jgi:hypothetical protein
MCAGVKPGVATLHDLNAKLFVRQIGLVDGRDLQFTAGAGFD